MTGDVQREERHLTDRDLHVVMHFLADFHGEVNDSFVGVPEDYRKHALALIDALGGLR